MPFTKACHRQISRLSSFAATDRVCYDAGADSPGLTALFLILLSSILALYGWDDLIFTHISARIPGPEHHFLINPYGMMFEEITATSVVKIDLNGAASPKD
jgi:Class II Aldolase and Adducin N-terminal domain